MSADTGLSSCRQNDLARFREGTGAERVTAGTGSRVRPAGEEVTGMDDAANQFARELADAIASAVADNQDVEECRARAREAGFDMRVTLEAVVGFVSRASGAPVAQVTTPARVVPSSASYELTNNDRRFLRSMRINTDDTREPVE